MKNNKFVKILIPFISVILVVIVVFCICFSNNDYSQSSFLMGTSVSVDINGKDDLSNDMILAVSNLDELISNTKTESEISQLNEKGTLEVSNQTLSLIKRSIELSEKTNGVFDITSGKLTELWNFNGGNTTVPSQKAIENALKTVGYKNIKIEGNTVTLLNNTKLDFGAVGKGAACDDAISVILNNKDSGVISVGGSVGIEGKNAIIGIRDPLGDANSYFATLSLSDAFVSTSGNYEKYFEVDGVRYCHILDLTTGYSVDNDILSVTIICDSGFVSDALSTTIYAMGNTTKASEILDYYNAEAIFVYSDKTVEVVNEKYNLEITGDGYEKK